MLIVAVAGLIGCGSALAAGTPRPPAAASYLFSIPTASGSLSGPNDQHLTLRLTISHPRWNAHQHTWTFSATRIRKQADNLPGATVHITPPRIANPPRFTDATLLIDDAFAPLTPDQCFEIGGLWMPDGYCVPEAGGPPYLPTSSSS
jgi:hypothetical protein